MRYLALPFLLFFSIILSAQTPIYEEIFTSQTGKGVSGPSPYFIDTVGVSWGIDTGTSSLSDINDYARVNSLGEFEASDVGGIIYWISPSIDISTYSTVDVHVDAWETGTISNSEFIRCYYILDSGTETLFESNGDLTGDFTSSTAQTDLLSGDSLRIKIAIRNSAGTKKHFFDNVRVSEVLVSSFYELQDVASVNFQWLNPGSSFDEIVVIGSTSPFSSGTPAGDGSSYSANPQWGLGTTLLGGTILYKGTGTSVTTTGLTLHQIHYARIYVRIGTSWSLEKEISFLFNPPSAGDVLLTEYARHPSISEYSYLEIYNTTGYDINLSGCKILANNQASISKIIDVRTEIPEPFIVPAQGFLILNRDHSQSNFESTWNVDLSSMGHPITYNRTGENNFGNLRFFVLKLGGTEDTDDGLLIDETTERPNPGFRVFQVPIGFFDSPESWEDATPGYLAASENPLAFQLAYAGNSWHSVAGSGISAPSPSTGNVNAVIRSGNAPFVNGSQLKSLLVRKNGTVDLTNETVTIDSLLLVESGGSIVVSGTGSISSNTTTTIQRKGFNATSNYNIWGSPFDDSLSLATVFPNSNPCDIFALEAGSQTYVYDYLPGSSTTCLGNPVTFLSNQVLDASEGVADGKFDIARGYFVPGNPDSERSFSATAVTLNNGTISANIFGSNGPVVDGSNDWNLLSNPYPSALSADDFLTQNTGTITNAVYLYNSNPGTSFSTYNSTDGFHIASCQGFFVDAQTSSNGLVGTVSFTNAMRSNQNNDFRSGNSERVMYLSATSKNGFSDPSRIYFDERAEWGFDYVFDAFKMKNSDMNFGSIIDEKPAVFTGIPNDFSKEIPLYFQHIHDGPVQFSLDSLVGDFSGYRIVLEDRWTKSYYNLDERPFLHISGGEYAKRFYLHVESALSDPSVSSNSAIFVYTESDFLVIRANGVDEIENLQIFSLDGREVRNQNGNSNELRIPVSTLATGVYIVKYYTNSGLHGQEKVVIR
jgi:hypothetical protein